MCNFHENIVALMLRKMRRTFIARQEREGERKSPSQNKRAHNLELHTHIHRERDRDTAKERHLESFRVALLL